KSESAELELSLHLFLLRKKERPVPFDTGLPGFILLSWGYRPSRARPFCGAEFACASTDVLACTRICARVSAAVSDAKSASRMALSLAVTFSSATDRLLMLDSRISFWNAPSRPRSVETCLIALSMMRWAV